MNNINDSIDKYLLFCQNQKQLDKKTLKAYRIDLQQFSKSIPILDISEATPILLENYIASLHQQYKPQTVKRKIASLKAFFHHLEYREIIYSNPFNKIQTRFREPTILPKTIPLYTIETLLSTILIFGKGKKERMIQIGNHSVIQILQTYKKEYLTEINNCNHFFVNQSGKALSDQSVRRMLIKYSQMADIPLHITPHMFRHTFATSLLEADVDIRYIQNMLGHSSINITEIYTHVTSSKQKEILCTKHPRNNFHI